MNPLHKLIVAAMLALVAGSSLAIAPASAGTCDQQGRRVLIKGVWHKIVHGPRGGFVDCGPAW
jgi:hypothetical protein